MTLSRRIYDFEYEIRDALKAIVIEAKAAAEAAGVRYKGDPTRVKFSVAGHAIRQANAIKVVAENGNDERFFEGQVHADFDALDRGPRKSGACVCEQFRTRLAVLTLLAPALSQFEHIHAVTIADRRHRVPKGELHSFSPNRAAEIVNRIHRRLKKNGVGSMAFGVVEVSVDQADGVMLFEPHVHAVIAGPDRADLGAAVPRGTHFSTKIVPIYHLKGQLLYLTKFQPEIRSSYAESRGNRGRRRNKMAPSECAEWLSWYADHGIAELLICFGFQPSTMRNFQAAEMHNLLDELIGRRGQLQSRRP